MPKKGKKGKKAAAEEAARLEAEQKAKEAEEKRKFEEQLVAREQAYDLGVPSCGGAFTPSTRLVSRNDGSRFGPRRDRDSRRPALEGHGRQCT